METSQQSVFVKESIPVKEKADANIVKIEGEKSGKRLRVVSWTAESCIDIELRRGEALSVLRYTSHISTCIVRSTAAFLCVPL
jgi:hypothetical protein